MFRRAFLAALAALFLAACGAIDTMKDGFAHSQAVSAELEKSLGLKPFVGFNWSNGSLASVTVTFQGLPQNANLREISAAAKRAIASEFKQSPQQIIISFAFEP